MLKWSLHLPPPDASDNKTSAFSSAGRCLCVSLYLVSTLKELLWHGRISEDISWMPPPCCAELTHCLLMFKLNCIDSSGLVCCAPKHYWFSWTAERKRFCKVADLRHIYYPLQPLNGPRTGFGSERAQLPAWAPFNHSICLVKDSTTQHATLAKT